MTTTTVELFARPSIAIERRIDDTVLLSSREPLGPFAASMAHLFRRHASAHPNRVLAAERDGDRWHELTWGEARATADALAQAFLDRGLGPDRPLMVLSGNSVAHLAVLLGAYTAGVPVLPISPAYSLLSHDHERVRAIATLCSPGMVFAEEAQAFGPALEALRETVPAQVVATGERAGAERLADLVATVPGASVERAFAALGPDTTAKILFTSGSTGTPKGVVNTHRMLCSNQQALGQIWPFLHAEPPVLVDWLPWSHTFGGNHNLGQVLAFGGTLYIDDGKPTPQLFERTIDALREVPPTVYFNVPAGFALLVGRVEQDRELAERFFSRLRFMFYAAAALPEALWERLRALAEDVIGRPVPLTASWGATESAPAATSAHFASARCGCIGVPLPGVTLKLVPAGEKLEIRLKGPNITPGYHRNPDATAAAFDDEGFYCTGDAVRPVNPADPDEGLVFDGRIAEDFKLVTGTWVTVGRLRTTLISEAGGMLSDAVIAGHGRDCVAALAWVSQPDARLACDSAGDVPLDHPRLREQLANALSRLNAGAGSASRVERLLLLDVPPDLDAGEITDKGYVNQRRVLERRQEAVERLFAEPLHPDVITPGG
jgi:feruloyl-CoA synthase